MAFSNVWNWCKALFKRRLKKPPPKFIIKQRLSAYNYFLMAYRKRTQSLGINFTGKGELLKRAAHCWGEMTAEEREPFEKHAALNAIKIKNPKKEREIKKNLSSDPRRYYFEKYHKKNIPFGFWDGFWYYDMSSMTRAYVRDTSSSLRLEVHEDLKSLTTKKRGKFT